MGKFGMSRAMGAGAGLGFAAGGAAVQMGGNYFADEFEESGNMAAAQTTDVLSGAGQGALYGAALGSVVPGIGTAAGAIIGGAIGLISGGVEAANRRAESEAEERRRKEEERAAKEVKQLTYQEELVLLMRKQAEQRAEIYFDTNRVTNSMLVHTPAL
jgi:phage tail tape-measure protein